MNKETSNTKDTQRLIDDYLLGILGTDERDEFQQKLAQDPNLSALVEEQKLLMQGVEEFNLRNSLNLYHSEIKKKSAVNSKYSWLAVAASIAIIVGITSWALFSNENSSDRIFAKNYVPDPGLPTVMGTSSNYDFYNGMVSYKRKNYGEAIAKWQSLYKEDKTNDTLNYFLGVANLAEGNFNTAKKYLRFVSQNKASIFSAEAHYYLALSQIKEDEIPEARQTLTHCTSSKCIFLLEQLKKME